MPVQYTGGGGGGGEGGVQYIGDVQYTGGCHEYSGRYHEYTGGCSVHRGDTMSTLGAYHDKFEEIS